MNQNPTADNDLQKAIDDITNTTNNDPVFADPVAAPSSIPEGDSGELAESVGPFPAPKPMPVPPKPISAPASASIKLDEAISDFSIPSAETISTETSISEEAPENNSDLSIREVKTAALRDLAPLIGKINLPASQKFNIYRDMFENLRDYTVIEPAYQAAKEITSETERAEALLYLIEAIDNM